jgi:nicotinamide riboside kinase
MRIGFCGAHRTGKTTLAKAVAQRLGIETVLSGTSAIVAEHGFNMALDNRLEVSNGIPMQQAILDALLEGQVGDNFVADRSPIDCAAYLLADATASAGDRGAQEKAMVYVESATREAFKRFDLLVLVPPALGFVSEDGKPPYNLAYQMHHHLLCRSLLLDRDEWLTVAVELPWEVTSLPERVKFVTGHIREAAANRKLRMATGTTRIYE